MRATAASSPRSPRAGISSSCRRWCRRRSTEAGAALDDVEPVAVTQGPGLIGALLVGLSAAKALAWARGLPLVPVDHLHGHVASLYLAPDPVEPPFLCLLASGGHTLLLEVRDHARLQRPRHVASTTRPARRSTRAHGCSASAIPAGRRSTGWRRTATPRRSRSRSPACDGPRLLVLRSEDRAALQGARARRRGRGAQGRPRRVVPARDRASARRADCGAPRSRRDWRRSPSSAASRRTRSCAQRFPAPASHRSLCAPTTRR